MGDELLITKWNLHSLPKDLLSIENAIILEQSRRFCLIIDP